MKNKGRPYQTSLRYSEDLKEIVEKCPGDSFSDKIEYACLSYSREKTNRENKIKELDKDINKRKKELLQLQKKISKYEKFISDIDYLKDRVKEVVKDAQLLL